MMVRYDRLIQLSDMLDLKPNQRVVIHDRSLVHWVSHPELQGRDISPAFHVPVILLKHIDSFGLSPEIVVSVYDMCDEDICVLKLAGGYITGAHLYTYEDDAVDMTVYREDQNGIDNVRKNRVTEAIEWNRKIRKSVVEQYS